MTGIGKEDILSYIEQQIEDRKEHLEYIKDDEVSKGIKKAINIELGVYEDLKFAIRSGRFVEGEFKLF